MIVDDGQCGDTPKTLDPGHAQVNNTAYEKE